MRGLLRGVHTRFVVVYLNGNRKKTGKKKQKEVVRHETGERARVGVTKAPTSAISGYRAAVNRRAFRLGHFFRAFVRGQICAADDKSRRQIYDQLSAIERANERPVILRSAFHSLAMHSHAKMNAAFGPRAAFRAPPSRSALCRNRRFKFGPIVPDTH